MSRGDAAVGQGAASHRWHRQTRRPAPEQSNAGRDERRGCGEETAEDHATVPVVVML